MALSAIHICGGLLGIFLALVGQYWMNGGSLIIPVLDMDWDYISFFVVALITDWVLIMIIYAIFNHVRQANKSTQDHLRSVIWVSSTLSIMGVWVIGMVTYSFAFATFLTDIRLYMPLYALCVFLFTFVTSVILLKKTLYGSNPPNLYESAWKISCIAGILIGTVSFPALLQTLRIPAPTNDALNIPWMGSLASYDRNVRIDIPDNQHITVNRTFMENIIKNHQRPKHRLMQMSRWVVPDASYDMIKDEFQDIIQDWAWSMDQEAWENQFAREWLTYVTNLNTDHPRLSILTDYMDKYRPPIFIRVLMTLFFDDEYSNLATFYLNLFLKHCRNDEEENAVLRAVFSDNRRFGPQHIVAHFSPRIFQEIARNGWLDSHWSDHIWWSAMDIELGFPVYQCRNFRTHFSEQETREIFTIIGSMFPNFDPNKGWSACREYYYNATTPSQFSRAIKECSTIWEERMMLEVVFRYQKFEFWHINGHLPMRVLDMIVQHEWLGSHWSNSVCDEFARDFSEDEMLYIIDIFGPHLSDANSWRPTSKSCLEIYRDARDRGPTVLVPVYDDPSIQVYFTKNTEKQIC